jgi:hypothetical protein
LANGADQRRSIGYGRFVGAEVQIVRDCFAAGPPAQSDVRIDVRCPVGRLRLPCLDGT